MARATNLRDLASPTRVAAFEDSFQELAPAPSPWPRLLSLDLAARYLSVSPKQISRLIDVGALSVVRLPVSRHENGVAIAGRNRRVLIDRLELDAIVSQNRERAR